MIRRKALTAELFTTLKQRNNLYAQKAKIRWLKEGDVNSKFFHRVINFRRKTNEIVGLNLNGQWTEDVKKIKDGVRNFFKDHFSKRGGSRPGLRNDLFEKKLSQEDNAFLIAPFSESEVKMAIDNCESSKSPGQDSFNFRFIKECWPTIKEDFTKMLDEFHTHGKLVRGLNPSFIVLIPKKEDVSCLSDIKPISLIGCSYKIMASKLSKVLDLLISVNQRAFVGKRNILDGVVILNEAIEEAKKKKLKRIFFKIDFAKAYDSVDWGFLDHMLEKFNFCRKWRKWILEYISSAHASVLINGSPSGEFQLDRGLRQGDPLSPFLYLLIAEGLSILVSKATNEGLFEAVEIGKDKLKVSHLQYADDTIFLGSTIIQNAWAMRRILRNFELLSGLKVNYNKCSLMGVNIERGDLEAMAAILGCVIGEIPFFYLGI